MQFTYDKKLLGLLAEIEEFLVAKTPVAVAKLKVTQPAYAVFLWYDDSSTDGDFAPDFGVGVESMLSAYAQRGASPESVLDCTWRPQQIIPELVPRGGFNDQGFISQCNEAYGLMLAANQTGRPLEDEGELLLPFRTMMHRAASRLYEYHWASVLNVTEEFVVVSADRIGYWLAEDLKRSVPEAKLKLLRQRGLLFDPE